MAATSLLSTITLPEMTDLVRRNFTAILNYYPLQAEQLFIVDDLTEHSGDSKRYTEYDVQQYGHNKPEGTNAQKMRSGVGYEKDMRAKRVAGEIEITEEMRRYNRYPEVVSRMTGLATICPNRYDLDLTHRLTFATATSYEDMDGATIDTTTGDGLSLANTAHTLAFSTTTYSNRLAGNPVFSQGALTLMEQLAYDNTFSDFGEQRSAELNTIFYAKNATVDNAVRQVLESTADIDAAQAGVKNMYVGKYRPLMLPMLNTTAAGLPDSTKKNWWGLVSAGTWQAYAAIFEPMNLKTPAPGNNGEDIHNDNWTYGVRMSYGIVTVGARNIFFSCPTS